MLNKDKVRGMFLGIAIGDALGLPCEGWPAEKIKESYGRLTEYHDPVGHKYFSGIKAGTTTDDTSLSLAVAESLIESDGFDLDSQAEHHVKAYKVNTAGWGRTTRDAVAKLADGTHWRESGLYSATDDKKPLGFGNGVPMKVGPIGLYLAAKPLFSRTGSGFFYKLASFAGMTHRTSMAVSSCIAHVYATSYCATTSAFDKKEFVNFVANSSDVGKNYFQETFNSDDIGERFRTLHNVTEETPIDKLIADYGEGNYYVYNSLPFAYAFFIRNPHSIESLYDCASAGGDTDSNASMMGSLLGVLNGTSIFPQKLIDGLICKNEIIKLADNFSEKFGI